MGYLELEVKTAFVFHGYDTHHREIVEPVDEDVFVKKLIALSRIQSISEDYVLVSGPAERLYYWEYKGTFAELKARLLENNVQVV